MAGTSVSRRRLLAGLLLGPPALAGCAPGPPARDPGPDPLVALAAAARADAALAGRLAAAPPDLARRVTQLRAARTAHAAALDAAVARLAGTTSASATPAPPASATPSPGPAPTPARLRATVEASGKAAAGAVLTLPADRVGLVASVAACCATYGVLLA